MKKLLCLLAMTVAFQSALADGSPVLKVILKGGISGRVNAVVSDLSHRPGAGSWCFDYVQQTLGSFDYSDVQFGSYLQLDVTDYRISHELLEYAETMIASNILKGTFTREVPDALTGCKRIYVLTWNSKNKFGDKGNIIVVKLDTPACLQSFAS